MFSSFRKSKDHSHCDMCFRAKQTRKAFFGSLNKSKENFLLIIVMFEDLIGPHGAVYFFNHS